jgi:hypothetical protein
MTGSFEEVGVPSVGETGFADAVSPDGSVEVDHDQPNGAFERTQSNGLVSIYGPSGNPIGGNVTGVSENEQVIVGTVGGAGLALPATAFRWTASGGAISIVSSANRGTANAVSEDGTIIAGDDRPPYLLTNGTDLVVIPVKKVSEVYSDKR